MIALRIFILLLAFTFQSEPLITREFIEQLRSEVDWEVTDYEDNIFKGWTLEEFKENFCNNELAETPAETSETDGPEESEDTLGLPEHFDGRVKWPKCIHPIRTQGRCGSCWAFGVAGSTSDRFCIAGKDVLLAPQDLVSCDKSNNGCKGGSIIRGLTYLYRRGAVSEECFPYTSGSGRTPRCPRRCTGSGEWVKHHCKAGSYKSIHEIPRMKQEIMEHGTVITAFRHYADFNTYKSGVYRHKRGAYICGHVMKPLGWGIENGLHYWIIANTYGENWGEKGYVRFKTRDCGIDRAMYSCLPRI
eukprot:TRINITY_DN56_c0_g1_i3.p1 TRINITY_DN56_c0_g1~~TRINITY_DN56_c0_g1_i3.p1  ORF type:complete len:303 (+),score=52.27 TRINITY_DN56_c0_g1_i3:121-1029(+)